MNTANPVLQKVGPPTAAPPQQPPIHPMAAAAAAAAYQQQQQAPGAGQAHQIDPEIKRMQDLIDALMLITNIRDDVTDILDNVGKTNQSLHQALSQIQQLQQHAATGDNNYSDVLNSETVQHLDLKDLEFLEKTDNKYLLDKVNDINKCIGELEQKLTKDIQPIQLFNYPIPDFNAILLDQTDDRISSHKLISNYRWCHKLQECLNCTSLMPYKRFAQPYSEKKSTKYKFYPMKQLKKDELDKIALSIVAPQNQAMMSAHETIKILTAQKSEHEFVMDILMPQNFKFVLLLFDFNVERLQVRPIEHRIPKIYLSRQRVDDLFYFDFEHKNSSNVFHRLEQNSLLACAHFKTEHGPNHIRYLLNWLKQFGNLFNAKCFKCEKHLSNGLPPTWRDLKTLEPLHDECKIY